MCGVGVNKLAHLLSFVWALTNYLTIVFEQVSYEKLLEVRRAIVLVHSECEGLAEY